MDYNELYHHGVKGMKWGVRRYQNKDGSLTAAGKKRQSQDTPEAAAKRKATAKKVAVGAAAALTIAAAATLYAKNPAVHNVVNSMANKTVSALKQSGAKNIAKGKAFVKAIPGRAKTAKDLAYKGVKEGVKEAVKEAPKKATKAVITGMTMNAVKKTLDYTVGKEEAAKIFKANNNKKIDSFWKVGPEDKDDD